VTSALWQTKDPKGIAFMQRERESNENQNEVIKLWVRTQRTGNEYITWSITNKISNRLCSTPVTNNWFSVTSIKWSGQEWAWRYY